MNVRFTSKAATLACLILFQAGIAGADLIPDELLTDDKGAELLNELAAPADTPLEGLLGTASPLAKRGYASYYASRFNGRRTTSGHRYHPAKLTAAHEDLPIGTVVRVINPATSQAVEVTVNDRCAPKPFPFIDLSRAAAEKIGLWGKGRMEVVIIPIQEEPA